MCQRQMCPSNREMRVTFKPGDDSNLTPNDSKQKQWERRKQP